MTSHAAALLEESTSQLCASGWTSSHDEANFPVFHKELASKIVSFCYQVIVHENGATLSFISQVNSPDFNAAFGVVADTKFIDIGISYKDFRVTVDTPQVADVMGLAQKIEDWGRSVDVPSEIAALATQTSNKTHESLKHFAALGVRGDHATLQSYLEHASGAGSRFGKTGPRQIKAAMTVARSA